MKTTLQRITPSRAVALMDADEAAHREGRPESPWARVALQNLISTPGYAVTVDGVPVGLVWRDTDVAAGCFGAWRSTGRVYAATRGAAVTAVLTRTAKKG